MQCIYNVYLFIFSKKGRYRCIICTISPLKKKCSINIGCNLNILIDIYEFFIKYIKMKIISI